MSEGSSVALAWLMWNRVTFLLIRATFLLTRVRVRLEGGPRLADVESRNSYHHVHIHVHPSYMYISERGPLAWLMWNPCAAARK